ncbi:MAG: hypothetical protein K2Q01_00415, partial [Rickettsiales bacterium]|nr:hypothetical protein [Rickettsiales bacterium]
NNFCMIRYEKGPKTKGAENNVLAIAGSNATTKGDTAKNDPPQGRPWALGWRGYVTTAVQENAFPNFPKPPSDTALIEGGLDNAVDGDIIVFHVPGRLPMIAFVKHMHFKDSDDQVPYTWAEIVFWDQGKYPTNAESTISAGTGPAHLLYRDEVPELYRDEVCSKELRVLTGKKPICTNADNPDLTYAACMDMDNYCVPYALDTSYRHFSLGWDSEGDPLWNQVKIYRRVNDVRRCPADASPFDLEATYKWLPPEDPGDGSKLPPVPPEIVLQSRTPKVASNIWSWCFNAGYDPPWFWQPGLEFKGTGTGSQTNLILCGAEGTKGWGSCNQQTETGVQFFPDGAGATR